MTVTLLPADCATILINDRCYRDSVLKHKPMGKQQVMEIIHREVHKIAYVINGRDFPVVIVKGIVNIAMTDDELTVQRRYIDRQIMGMVNK